MILNAPLVSSLARPEHFDGIQDLAQMVAFSVPAERTRLKQAGEEAPPLLR